MFRIHGRAAEGPEPVELSSYGRFDRRVEQPCPSEDENPLAQYEQAGSLPVRRRGSEFTGQDFGETPPEQVQGSPYRFSFGGGGTGDLDRGIGDQAAGTVVQWFGEQRQKVPFKIIQGRARTGVLGQSRNDKAVQVMVERRLAESGLVAKGVVEAANAEPGCPFQFAHRRSVVAVPAEGMHRPGEHGVLIEGTVAAHGPGF